VATLDQVFLFGDAALEQIYWAAPKTRRRPSFFGRAPRLEHNPCMTYNKVHRRAVMEQTLSRLFLAYNWGKQSYIYNTSRFFKSQQLTIALTKSW